MSFQIADGAARVHQSYNQIDRKRRLNELHSHEHGFLNGHKIKDTHIRIGTESTYVLTIPAENTVPSTAFSTGAPYDIDFFLRAMAGIYIQDENCIFIQIPLQETGSSSLQCSD